MTVNSVQSWTGRCWQPRLLQSSCARPIPGLAQDQPTLQREEQVVPFLPAVLRGWAKTLVPYGAREIWGDDVWDDHGMIPELAAKSGCKTGENQG